MNQLNEAKMLITSLSHQTYSINKLIQTRFLFAFLSVFTVHTDVFLMFGLIVSLKEHVNLSFRSGVTGLWSLGFFIAKAGHFLCNVKEMNHFKFIKAKTPFPRRLKMYMLLGTKYSSTLCGVLQ